MKSLLIAVVFGLALTQTPFSYVDYTTWPSTCSGPKQSPISINRTIHSCQYGGTITFNVENQATSFQTIFNQLIFKSYNFQTATASVMAPDENNDLSWFDISSVNIHMPGEHKFVDSNVQSSMEIQFVFIKRGSNLTAQFSVLLQGVPATTNKLFNGNQLLFPFFTTYGVINNSLLPTTIEANLYQVFQTLQYYNNWYSYQGTNTLPPCAGNTIWFINSQILQVDQVLINRYINQIQSGQLKAYQQYLYENQFNSRPIQNTDAEIPVSFICGNFLASTQYTQYMITKMTQNFALWLWIVLFGLFFVVFLLGSSNTQNLNSIQMIENKWTNVPFYSIYMLNHDKYFPRNLRLLIYFLKQGVAILIVSVIFKQLPFTNRNQVALVGLIGWACAIPIGWIAGYLTIQIIEQRVKEFKLLKEVKNNIEFIENIEQLYGIKDYSNFLNNIFFIGTLILMACAAVSVEEMQNQPEMNGWWYLLSCLVSVLFDFAADIILALLPINHIQQYRGFYFDQTKIMKCISED